jgi:D-lyxose ketol-isomerase
LSKVQHASGAYVKDSSEETVMKRSKVNAIMEEAVDFFQENNFSLPPFAYWRPDDWAQKGLEVEQIVQNELGWDITDYGLGDFYKYGLLLFTLRNGGLEHRTLRTYAEKVMIAEEDQIHQMHFHWRKVEDIINRAGGDLCIELYNATQDETLDNNDVIVYVDGVRNVLPAGGVVRLKPGESITLTSGMYHKFWAEGGRVLMGEVSTINDDKTDNCFYQPIGSGRFSEIEEDVPPLYLLFSDYTHYWWPDG